MYRVLSVYALHLSIDIAPLGCLQQGKHILLSICHAVNRECQVDQPLYPRPENPLCLFVDCTIGSQFPGLRIF